MKGWWNARVCNVVLGGIVILQWCLFPLLLQHVHDTAKDSLEITSRSSWTLAEPLASPGTAQKRRMIRETTAATAADGVFVTILFRAPRWMHLRYTAMIQNALVNLPTSKNWKVQVFVNRPWADKELIPWHPWLQRRMAHNNNTSGDPRLIVTALPHNLTLGKPKDVLLSSWFWNSVAADAVVLFSGNGAFCGNANDNQGWEYFVQHVDYCGAPGGRGVRGGDSSTHSYRNASIVRRALEYAQQHSMEYQGGTEFAFLAHVLQEMKSDPDVSTPIRIGTTEDTEKLGGVQKLTVLDQDQLWHIPLLVSGTQARLEWKHRDSLLKHCPELKLIFPSMHEPACFGAHPKPDTCKASICALQDDLPGHGC